MCAKYLAVVRLHPEEGAFVIGSPDFPDLAERCTEFDDITTVATAAILERLGKLRAEGRVPPSPTPKTALETRAEYRECFLVGVEAQGWSNGGD